jgi:hypothetical protein
MAFTYDKAATARRWRALSQYLETQVLGEDDFVCKHYAACRQSHPGPFHEGQLHHLGRYYDVLENGIPLRIVVVGQEYGAATARISLAARCAELATCGQDLRFRKTGTYPGRNPHMKGTTSVLRLLFGGEPGTDHASEFVHFEDGTSCHLFDAFSLVNYLLCAAHETGSTSRGKSSRIMKANCGSHFRPVLEILEPTVLIVQGKGIWRWVRGAFDRLDAVQGQLYCGRINGMSSLVASFTHPSTGNYRYNWGVNEQTPYLQEVVRPTIAHLRSLVFGSTTVAA